VLFLLPDCFVVADFASKWFMFLYSASLHFFRGLDVVKAIACVTVLSETK